MVNDFEDKKKKEKMTVLNKAAKIVLNKIRYKKNQHDEIAINSWQAMSRAVSWKAKARGPGNGNKTSA